MTEKETLEQELPRIADLMRTCGIARFRLSSGYEVELAPYLFEPKADIEDVSEGVDVKADGTCREPGCTEPIGWMGGGLCRRHGLRAAGVKGA